MDGTQDLEHALCAPVRVESGLLAGLQLPTGARNFLGVPYAAPPVEELRWRPPQRPLPWTGVRLADKFGPSSIQFPPPATSLYSGGETEFSEDCLHLNIYTGAPTGAGSDRRPVLVWFHMGAFMWGSGSHPWFNGTHLASRGATVVTVNYRLGRLGFLAHPDLTAESEAASSGNYGVLDQIAALEWVRRNIAAFGGDLDNVTIAGSSAGGASVHLLRASPLARSLFAKAICDGGPGLAPPSDGLGHVATYLTLAAAESTGVELMDALGVQSIAELRKLPTGQILSCQLARAQGPWKTTMGPFSTSLSVFDGATPIIDGHVIPESPLAVFLSGSGANVPLLAGNAGNEASATPYLDSVADYHAFAKEAFGGHAGDLLRLYPADTDLEARAATARLIADQCFVWPTWTSARLQARHMKSPVWYYRSMRAPPIPSSSALIEKDFAGAFHVSPALYAFGTLDSGKWAWTDDDRALSARVMGEWVRFMQTGRPDGVDEAKGAGSWPALGHSDHSIQILDTDCRLEAPEPSFWEMVAFWDKYYGLQEPKKET